MIARVGLAAALLAGVPGAALAAEQPAAPAPRPARNVPPPRVYAPPTYQEVPTPPASPALRRFRIPPQVEYPIEALRNDIRGRCIVTFSVDAEGVPQDIAPDCTDPVFTIPARNAVAAARLNMDAGITPGDVLRLPLRFAIEDDTPPQE